MLTQVASVLIQAFVRNGALVTDENPIKSFHWAQPCMQVVLDHFLLFSAVLDYCAYGAPWRKRTRIAASGDFILPLSQTCPGCPAHTVLRGKTTRNGQPVSLTALASPYPSELVSQWAGLLRAAVSSQASGRPPSGDLAGEEASPCVNLNLVGASQERVLQEQQAAQYSHIDDHVVFGSDREAVASVAWQWCQALRSGGFVVDDPSPTERPIERYIGYAS